MTHARTTLVNALCLGAGEPQRRKVRQFLLGLSVDELQYVAEFFGSCILEDKQPSTWTHAQRSECIQRFALLRRQRFEDRDHKMVLLLEYLARSSAEAVRV